MKLMRPLSVRNLLLKQSVFISKKYFLDIHNLSLKGSQGPRWPYTPSQCSGMEHRRQPVRTTLIKFDYVANQCQPGLLLLTATWSSWPLSR